MLATIIALVLETAGVRFISAYSGDAFAYRLLFYYIVVACSEEGAKYLLMRFKTWNSSAFNCQFDGVVYAVSVSLGFALLENIMYVLQYGMATAVVRAFTAIMEKFNRIIYGAYQQYLSFSYSCRDSNRKRNERLQ